MVHSKIQTDQAPKAVGAYSQGIRAGQTLYLSGQIPLDPATGHLVGGDFATQLRRIFENLGGVLAAENATFADVVKLTVYLTDLANYPALNQVMSEFFSEPYPARAAVGVASLPLGVPVEVEGIAVLRAEDYQY